MTRTNGEVVGFAFQEIPLEEARNVVLAGDGNYADVKQTLLDRLPELAPDKAFAFGLPNGQEVPEDKRRGLCMAVNATLKRAKIPWRVTYSGTRKLFICVPQFAPKEHAGHTPKSKWDTVDNTAILKLWNAGKSVPAIISMTGENPERVRYLCYQANPHKHRIEDTQAIQTMKTIVAEASRAFKITPEHIQQGLGRAKVVRKAICVVACKRHIAPRVIAPYVGISKDGVAFNSRQATAFGKKEISELESALKN